MLPVQITVKEMKALLDSPTADNVIRKKAEKLTQYCDRISSCRVVIEVIQKHKRQGKLFNVRIDLTVPGKELAVTRKCDEDLYVAIRDAFKAIERQLEEYSRKRHGRVKTHNGIMHGHVTRMMPREGYGFIEGIDGNEYYFSITNVSYPSFAQLAVGDAVEYHPEPFNDGWQAHHVIRERNNNHVAA